MYKNLTIKLVTILIILSFLPNISADETILDEVYLVQVNYYAAYNYTFEKGVKYNVEVVSDSVNIDLLLLDEKNFEKYNNGEKFDHFKDGSALNITTKRYSFKLSSAKKYYIVYDNTADPENGAYSGKDANMQVRITEVVPIKEEGNSNFTPFLMIIGGLALLLFTVFLYYKLIYIPENKTKQKSQKIVKSKKKFITKLSYKSKPKEKIGQKKIYKITKKSKTDDKKMKFNFKKDKSSKKSIFKTKIKK